MALHKIKKGLNLPITGEPTQTIDIHRSTTRVALMAEDYVGMRPTMFVQEGEKVLRGQPLFEDKKNPGVRYVAPGAGKVTGINRGDRRALKSVVVELNEAERKGQPGAEDEVAFESYQGKNVAAMNRGEVRALLVESGLWTAFRTRPFSRIPALDSTPAAIFITAMDTSPLAPSAEIVLKGKENAFKEGLLAIVKLTDGPVYLCKSPDEKIPSDPNSGVQVEDFDGPHPAGLPGVHIHFLRPVSRLQTVWYISYQDVAPIGTMIKTGRLDVNRVVSLAGPRVSNPRLIATRIGASTMDICEGELNGDDNRIISGSVLAGRKAMGDVEGYMGRYHQQVSVIREGHDREFLGWVMPGMNKYSTTNAYLSRLAPGKKFDMTTNTCGSRRAMVPIGTYERVMPMDIMATFLLRALIVGDIERAEQLGVLELDEEDVALFTFVCPGKYEYGPILRQNLEKIYKEG